MFEKRKNERGREYLNSQILIQSLKPKKSHNSSEFLEQKSSLCEPSDDCFLHVERA